MKASSNHIHMDDSLLVDISDALSERDRVRFTVHTRTKLPQFAKPVLSVVRQHEEFIWLHDCLVENDQYAGYIIPPPPPRPDFDSSREKLQRLGDCEASLTKDEFAKMKQELEAEYLAIFKKTVAMHEIFLQRLAGHEKFRQDNNFKIFLEYENELAVRGKSKREKIAGSISNLGKSLTDFVITTSQVANTNSISGLAGVATGGSHASSQTTATTGPGGNSNYNSSSSNNNNIQYNPAANIRTAAGSQTANDNSDPLSPARDLDHGSSNTNMATNSSDASAQEGNTSNSSGSSGRSTGPANASDDNDSDGPIDGGPIDEQYFERERLFLALYYNSIRETAHCADRVAQAHKCVADSYLNMGQQFVRLAGIEVVPVTAKTVRDISSSGSVAGPLPSLTLPGLPPIDAAAKSPSSRPEDDHRDDAAGRPSTSAPRDGMQQQQQPTASGSVSASDATRTPTAMATTNSNIDKEQSDTLDNNINSSSSSSSGGLAKPDKSTGGCASDHTSDGLKKLLLHVSDYLEQAKKIEARIASDEDLKLTDTFLYYKRDTVAAQELLARRLRFMAEYESATKNVEKARVKGRTALQYAEVIQKQAHENFMSISRQAKQELIDYKRRRIASFRKSFVDLAELETKHLKSHAQLIKNCLNICRGMGGNNNSATTSTSTGTSATAASTSLAGAHTSASTSNGDI